MDQLIPWKDYGKRKEYSKIKIRFKSYREKMTKKEVKWHSKLKFADVKFLNSFKAYSFKPKKKCLRSQYI